MRFLSTFFLLSALSILQVFARMNQLVSRTTHDHPAIARRQHHQTRSSLVDICAPIEISLLEGISVKGIIDAGASVKVHICLCISVVHIFVKADVRMKAYVDQVGEEKAIVDIKEMIRTADRSRSCHFPPHSIPMLSAGSSCDPCTYRCAETYHKRDGQCLCEGASFECNGKCALSCGSSAPKRSFELSDGVDNERFL